MMAVVSQLQHAILTMPWPIRCAAAQATAKVWLYVTTFCSAAVLLVTSEILMSGLRTGGSTIGGAVQDPLL